MADLHNKFPYPLNIRLDLFLKTDKKSVFIVIFSIFTIFAYV